MMLQAHAFSAAQSAYSPFLARDFDFSLPLPAPRPAAQPLTMVKPSAPAPAVYLEFDTGMLESHGVTHDATLTAVCPRPGMQLQYRVRRGEGEFSSWDPAYHQPVEEGEYTVQVRYLNRRGVPSRSASLAFTLLNV